MSIIASWKVSCRGFVEIIKKILVIAARKERYSEFLGEGGPPKAAPNSSSESLSRAVRIRLIPTDPASSLWPGSTLYVANKRLALARQEGAYICVGVDRCIVALAASKHPAPPVVRPFSQFSVLSTSQ